MTPEQQQLLAEKRTSNFQRRLAAKYVDALDSEIRSTLTKARIVVRPESDPVIAFRQFDARGFSLAQVTQPLRFKYARYDDMEEMYNEVREIKSGADEAIAYFCPTYFTAQDESRRWLSDDPPVFEVQFGWARLHFPALHAAAGQGCNLTTCSGDAGILSRVTCGWQDRHADDRVHELAWWGV
jgi:hypothetical protein